MSRGLFGGYCYGPVDLVKVRRIDNSMQLQLRTIKGGIAYANYDGCVYWRLDSSQKGMHIPIVQQMTADELIDRNDSDTLLSLQKNSNNVEKLLHDWEDDGLKFYLHYGTEPGSEYLIAARNMKYREIS